MKGKWKQTSKKKKANAVLQKYTVALEEFVKSKGSSENVEHNNDFSYVKKKSRKELRKEKQKLKKAKMKSHYEGKKDFTATPVVSENTVQEKNTQKKKKSGKFNKYLSDTSSRKISANKQVSSKASSSKIAKKTTKLQEMRRQALLEANEQEDREIKKLERSLGLNKRKNKKSLPKSFVADGLDYILGVLDSGSSGAAMYNSEDDLDMAKDNFSKLEKKESEGSDEEEQQISSDEDEGPEAVTDENDSLVESLGEDMGGEESEGDQGESNGEEEDELMVSEAEDEEKTTDAQVKEENTGVQNLL